VYLTRDQTFKMSGGEISGNTAVNSGGGVYVFYNGIFTKTGGTIYGYNAGNNSNTVTNSGVMQSNKGHAVFVNKNPSLNTSYHRENTAGPGINLDTGKSGSAGGWE